MKSRSVHALLAAAMVIAWAALPAVSRGDSSGLCPQDFQQPKMEYRPWVRWWWPGADVEESELEREVDLLAGAGIGGAEIQAFTMGLNPGADAPELERRLAFDTASYYGKVSVVMEAAHKAGMGIDLNLGSGWPSGGRHISEAQGMKTLLWGEKLVRGPRKGPIKLHGPKKPLFYYIAGIAGSVLHSPVAEYRGDEAKLLAVAAARITGGKRSRSPLNLSDSLELDPASVVVLTSRADASGRLDWDAPPGRWLVLAVYSAPDGEYATLAAQPSPGLVVDHLDREAILFNLDHLAGERTGLAKFYGAPFRAFFNDSFEFKTERHFSADFMEEFKRRRGYDLEPLLPAVLVPGGDDFFLDAGGLHKAPEYKLSADDVRVRYDYSLTVSDLFIERCLDALSGWAHERGLESRAQGYGMDIDVIRASGHAGIPETEQLYAGGSEMFMKISSSGAHLYGKNVVTAESMVWSGRDYMTTPLKIKAAADKLFTAGINGVIHHGYSYKTDRDYGETGWFPWSSPYTAMGVFSTNLSEANPLWKYVSRINLYIARCQYLLRQGAPRTDLLVYYPWLGLPSSFSSAAGHHEFLFNGFMEGFEPAENPGGLESLTAPLGGAAEPADPRIAWLEKIWPVLVRLEDHGCTWEWVNDESLALAEPGTRELVIRGNHYKSLVIADAPWMQPEAAGRLSELAKTGSPFLVIGAPPSAQPGLHDKEQGDHAVRQAMSRVLASDHASVIEDPAMAVRALAESGVLPGAEFPEGPRPVRRIVRDLGGSWIMFLRNPAGTRQEFVMNVEGGCGQGVFLDAWTGKTFRARAEDGSVLVRLHPYGSMFLVCGEEAARFETSDDDGLLFREDHERAVPLRDWDLAVSGEDVAGGEYNDRLEELLDWRGIKQLRFCSTPGTYTTEVDGVEAGPGKSLVLDLGWIYGAAEISVNGMDAGVLLVPPYRVDVTGLMTPGRNVIEVTVTPPLRNRFIGQARKRAQKYKQFKGKEDTLLPAGLTGPARMMVFGNAKENTGK